jgi:hypothetical protein
MTKIKYLLVHKIFSRDTSSRKERFGTIPLQNTYRLYGPRAFRLFPDLSVRSAARMIPELRGAVKRFPEFFDNDGLVHYESVPPGQSVSGHLYVQIFREGGLSYTFRRKWCNKWQDSGLP